MPGKQVVAPSSGFTLVHFIVSFAGNMLPAIVAIFYCLFVASDWNSGKVLYADGQFYIYAATFLTTAGFTFFAYSAHITDRYFLGGLVVSAFLFAISNLYAWKLSVQGFSDGVLFWTSMVPFVVSLPFFYYALRMTHRHADPSKFKYQKLLSAMREDRKKVKQIDDALDPETKQKEIDEVADDLPDN